jgi:pseudouridine synthase
VRINKYIASCGAASRRGADALVEAGRVTVNGNIAQSHGMAIDELSDTVCLDGVKLELERDKVYIMLNKPAGILSTCHDDRGRKTVLDLVKDVDERLFPVGRLDYDTEGLLLMTNDGDFALRCTHPRHEQNKTYYAKVKGELTPEDMKRLELGIEIEGRMTSQAQISIMERYKDGAALTITIHEGRNRQVRNMFEAIDCYVSYLKRTAVGHLTLGNLGLGQWRHLTEKDFSLLGIIMFSRDDTK